MKLYCKPVWEIELSTGKLVAFDNDFCLYEEFEEALAQNYKHMGLARHPFSWQGGHCHVYNTLRWRNVSKHLGLDQNGEPTCLVTDFLIMDLQETYESSWFLWGNRKIWVMPVINMK